ncbi:MAG: hypothetical protein ACYDBL_11830 [Candidatus Acidiferrales bacterium]
MQKAAKPFRGSWAAGAIVVALAAGMMPCGMAHAQSTGPLIYKPPPPSKTSHIKEIRKAVNLVLVNVTVTDPYGRLVTDWIKKTSVCSRTGKSSKSCGSPRTTCRFRLA